jgi:hypothetical protein
VSELTRPSPLLGALERLAQSGALEPLAFGGGARAAPAPPVVAAPEPVKPTLLPDPEDPAILAARRRQLQRAAGRSGRASTVLSSQEDYSTDKTGVA